VDDATSAITPLDPELVQVGDFVGHRPGRSGLIQGAVRRVRVVEVLLLAQHDPWVALIPDQGPVQQLSRLQLPIHLSMIEFIRGA
jgi:hypothetical protein